MKNTLTLITGTARLLAIAFLMCSTLPAFSQKIFHRIYGGADYDANWTGIALPGGQFATLGYEDHMDDTTNFFGKKMYLNIFDTDGNLTAARVYGFLLDEKAYNLLPLADGGLLLMGEGKYCINFNCGTDAYLIRTAADGSVTWGRGFGGLIVEDIRDAVELPGGDLVVMGSTASFGNGNYDIFLARLHASGDTVWTRTYGSVAAATYAQETAYGLVKSNDGGLVAAGQVYREADNSFHPFVFKTDSNGTLVWSKLIENGLIVDAAYDILAVADGYVWFSDKTLAKFSENGTLLWSKTLPATWKTRFGQYNYGGMGITSSGGFALAGAIGNDAGLLVTDASGDLIFSRKFDSGNTDMGAGTGQLPDGRFFLSGYCLNTTTNMPDASLWVTDAQGNLGTCSADAQLSFGAGNALAQSLTLVTGSGVNSATCGASMWVVPPGEYSTSLPCVLPYSPVSVDAETARPRFSLYPNPAGPLLHLSFEAGIQGTMQLLSAEGRLIRSEVLQDQIETASLSPGLYLLRITENSGQSTTLKWIRN